MSIRVGVDVGGTNTDAVAFSNNNLVAVAKSPTTLDVTSGVTNAIQEVIKIGKLNSNQISAVMVGTTHFVNALIESKHLLPTAVIRLCGKTTQAILP
ncbi:MAG: hydantoinase/oxoprolinase N-terminal domain-containing protein, partial [Gammaproteobacteria bacterium]